MGSEPAVAPPVPALPRPERQIAFAFKLEEGRELWLETALAETLRHLDLPRLDRELAEMVPGGALAALAAAGLRGERLFATPLLLRANPRLLGYYRLLLGFSQKEFYGGLGLGRFRALEERGSLAQALKPLLPALCRELVAAGVGLLDGVGAERISLPLLQSLQLLTLGPQFQGSDNVRKGVSGIFRVFAAIEAIVAPAVERASERQIAIRNAAGRPVLIEFAPDPDIILREEMEPGNYRNIIAIEVKGGTDFSNIHNRIGEAEKSHQKARSRGFVECWTVVNVDRIDLAMACRESPTTNRFYRLSTLDGASGDDYQDFRNRIISLAGIPAPR